MMSVKPELDVRKYFEFKLMMGFDERYAITKPLGDYAAMVRKFENSLIKVEDAEENKTVEPAAVQRKASFYPKYRKVAGEKEDYPVK